MPSDDIMVRRVDMSQSTTNIDECIIAEKIVQVPQMAESISEGTLKQWSKSMYCELKLSTFKVAIAKTYSEIGDHVERDEEIATIETDKV